MTKRNFINTKKWLLTVTLFGLSYVGNAQTVFTYPRQQVTWLWPDTTSDDVYYGSADGDFSAPATDSKGNLWTIQQCGRQVISGGKVVSTEKFVNIRNISNMDLKPLASIGDNYGKIEGEQLELVSRLFVSPTDVLYYLDAKGRVGYKVLKLSPDGRILNRYDINTNNAYAPQVAFGKDNSIFVISNKAIYKYDTTFNLLKSLTIDPLDYVGASDPTFQGGTTDSNGDLYVSADGVICKYDKNLNFVWRKKLGNASLMFYNKIANQLWINVRSSIVIYDPITFTQIGTLSDELIYVAFDNKGDFFGREFKTYKYTVTSTTGLISNVTNSNDVISAYPSPNTGQFSIKASVIDISKIELVDVLGHQEIHYDAAISTQLKGLLRLKVYLKNGQVEMGHVLVRE